MVHRLFQPKGMDSRNEGIWLTIYADMVTNLALVFLALFGLTIMGEDAVAKAVQSMRLQDIATLTDLSESYSFHDVAAVLRTEFGKFQDIQVREGEGVVWLGFGENVLFESGRAALKPSAHEPLKKAAQILKIIPQTVVVEGHSDDRPLKKGGLYRDNWELSLARTMSVVRYLSQEGRLPQNQLAAAAYGSYRPIGTNTTPLGRRLNRRVEIAIYKDFPYEKEAQ